MKNRFTRPLRFLYFFFPRLLGAQQAKPATAPPQAPPPPLVTPEVHSDNSVTFPLRAPNAQEVKLAREGTRTCGDAKE